MRFKLNYPHHVNFSSNQDIILYVIFGPKSDEIKNSCILCISHHNLIEKSTIKRVK